MKKAVAGSATGPPSWEGAGWAPYHGGLLEDCPLASRLGLFFLKTPLGATHSVYVEPFCRICRKNK